MNVETVFPLLASLCGLIAFVIVVVRVIRYIDSRGRREARPIDPKDTTPPPPAGLSVVPRSFAGNWLVGPILVGTLAGLLVFAIGLPAWLKAHPAIPAWVGEKLAPIGAVALFVAVLIVLVGVLRGLRGADSPMPDPMPDPRPEPWPTTDPETTRPFHAGCGLLGLIALMLLCLLALGVGVPVWQAQGRIAPGTSVALTIAVAAYWVVLAVLIVQRSKKTVAQPLQPKPRYAAVSLSAPSGDCPKCGKSIPAGSPQGLCPRCLLQGVMPSASQPSPTLAFVEAYVAPTVEEVAKLFPQLEIKELIGQGGMGAVYLARQTALDRFVALKLVRPRETDPTFAERFVREAKAMARLNHPHVVAVYESGAAGGLPYLVMEFVDGVTLRDAMRARKLTPSEALGIVPQICEALEYAHAQGVVHRDVKPENILLGRDGRVKIADFGLAKVTDPAGVSLTGTRQAMGTPHYMAPEQWEKPGEVDHRADIYALGVVLYELLTGELPIGRFDPPSQKIRLDIRLDEIVLRALAKEPDRRYQHASDVKTALDAIRSGAGGWVHTPTFREYRSKRTFLGLPLVHIVSGLDPQTGRVKVAKGWLAIGDGRAIGGIALAGGSAFGGVAVSGGVSLGLLSGAGGVAFGGFAMAGGMAFAAAVAAAGGMAIAGVLAMAGGFAGGTFAAASSARGEHVLSASRQDANFGDMLDDWMAMLWPF